MTDFRVDLPIVITETDDGVEDVITNYNVSRTSSQKSVINRQITADFTDYITPPQGSNDRLIVFKCDKAITLDLYDTETSTSKVEIIATDFIFNGTLDYYLRIKNTSGQDVNFQLVIY